MKQFKKLINVILIINILFSYFIIPTYFVYASTCTGYRVAILKSDGTSTDLGCFTNYNDAKTAMLNHNSNESSVAVIYNSSGKIINAKYAIAKFVPGIVSYLYPSASSTTAFTYTSTSYGSDVAFIDYNPTYNRAKIRISGYTGWVKFSDLTIVPINQLFSSQIRIDVDSINVRQTPSTTLTPIGSVFKGQRHQYYDVHIL